MNNFPDMNRHQIVQSSPPPDSIDLGMGNPDYSLLPMGLLHKAADTYFATMDPRPLQYGLEQGNAFFRHALARFLAMNHRGVPVDPDLLFVTTGASSALDLICTLYTRSGDVILVEEPSYFLALRIFEDHGLKVISLPMDGSGVCLDTLEDRIAEYHPKLIYIIPAFQNPSGVTLTQGRREKLITLAQRHNVLIVADEVYHLLAYTQPPPRSFASYVGEMEQVISVNSFSKILAPGLRLGWIQAGRTVIRRLSSSGLLDSGGGMNPFTSALVANLIESGGLEDNIANLRDEYASRLNAMGMALRQYLPTSEWLQPHGGFFYWVRLPGVDAAELRARAQDFNVGLRQGTLFSSRNEMQDYFRLSFSFYDPERIEEGIKRLGVCLETSFDDQ